MLGAVLLGYKVCLLMLNEWHIIPTNYVKLLKCSLEISFLFHSRHPCTTNQCFRNKCKRSGNFVCVSFRTYGYSFKNVYFGLFYWPTNLDYLKLSLSNVRERSNCPTMGISQQTFRLALALTRDIPPSETCSHDVVDYWPVQELPTRIRFLHD